MKQFLYIILLLALHVPLLAQEQSEERKSYFGVYIMPTTLVDPTPRLRLGALYNTGGQWGMSLDIGYGGPSMSDYSMIWPQAGEDYRLIEVRPELKYYKRREENSAFYMAGELFLINMSCTQDGGYYYYGNKGDILFDWAEYERLKVGFYVKTGIETLAFNRLLMEIYTGLGLAYRDIDYNNVVNARTGEYERHIDFGKNAKPTLIPQLALGIKLGLVQIRK